MKKNKSILFIGISFALIIALFGCSDRNSITAVQPPPPAFATYDANMKPLFDASCAISGCHAGSSPMGNYNLSSYAGVLGNGSDGTPNVIAGDSASLIITKVKNGTHFAWNTPTDQYKIDLLIQWIVIDNSREN